MTASYLLGDLRVDCVVAKGVNGRFSDAAA
jgi:hypothetical protein